MRRSSRLDRSLAALALFVLFAVVVSACGGGGSSGGSSTKSADPNEAATHSAKSEPSLEFVGSGPNGKLATEGKESTVAEREEASRIVEEMERAREHRNWAGQCKTFSATYAESTAEGAPKGGPETCAAAVEALARGEGKSVLDSTMIEPIAALRVIGQDAFAFYHGAKGKKYVIPLEKEDGEWRLVALKEFELS